MWGRSEMRKQQLGVVLPLLHCVSGSSSGSDAEHGHRGHDARCIAAVNVVRGDGAVSVEIRLVGR